VFKNPTATGAAAAKRNLYLTVLHSDSGTYTLGQTIPYITTLEERTINTATITYNLDWTTGTRFLTFGDFTVGTAVSGTSNTLLIAPNYLTHESFDDTNQPTGLLTSSGGFFNFLYFPGLAAKANAGVCSVQLTVEAANKFGLKGNQAFSVVISSDTETLTTLAWQKAICSYEKVVQVTPVSDNIVIA